MSRETSEWLNTMILVGYTDKRGTAWHYRVQHQGVEPNHYAGAIPFDDVNRRLFGFEFIEAEVLYRLPDGRIIESTEGRKGMITSDTDEDLGSFKSGYQGHQYSEWLLENVGTVLDTSSDEIGIGSAGLLRKRAQAFVSIEVPENIVTPEGVEFRPSLLACTSFDGTLATTYKRVNTRVVCDNTQEMALGEEGQQFKVKHTKYSGFQIHNAREALQVIHSMGDDFAAEVEALCNWKVTDAEFEAAAKILIPDPGDDAAKAALTRWDNKRQEVFALYRNDQRVASWHGTAFGVLQAYNTWNQHYASVRKGVPRDSRNMENVLNGKTSMQDQQVLTVLRDVTITPESLAV